MNVKPNAAILVEFHVQSDRNNDVVCQNLLVKCLVHSSFFFSPAVVHRCRLKAECEVDGKQCEPCKWMAGDLNQNSSTNRNISSNKNMHKHNAI